MTAADVAMEVTVKQTLEGKRAGYAFKLLLRLTNLCLMHVLDVEAPQLGFITNVWKNGIALEVIGWTSRVQPASESTWARQQ